MQSPHPALRFAGIVLLLLGTTRAADPLLSERNRFDIETIDAALAQPVSEQETVPFGDTMVRVDVLRYARARLSGDSEQAGQLAAAVTKPASAFQWPGGIVYYRFDLTTNISAAHQTQFRDSIAEWAAFADLTFVEFTSPLPTNYITVRDDPTLNGGNSSSIGMAGGEQIIRIGSTSWNRGTICHEMGHALGYYHEQQRFDRDDYVTILAGNITAGYAGNFTKIDPTTTHGPYDFLSVMHYSRHAFANPSTADTIQPLPAYSQYIDLMGNVFYRTLSKLDRAGMAAVYGAPAAPPSAVVSNTRDSGAGSLRTALYYAFDRSVDTPGTLTPLVFNIPTSDPGFSGGVFKIQPTYGLVAPGNGTVIDGATQTAFTGNTNASGPEIWLDGSALTTVGLFAPGLRLLGANCAVRNLCISNFNQEGILIDGAAATGNTVTGCYSGTDPTGAAAAPNAFSAVRLVNGAHDNTIGGLTVAERNVLSGNTQNGISILNAGTSGNVVQGNYVGLNAAGTAALPNRFVGISLSSAASSNLIGGLSAGSRNVISGNLRHGISISGAGSDGNTVQGNYIGLNPAGTVALGNGFEDAVQRLFASGLQISTGAKNNLIGGTAAGARNVISGNALRGVNIGDSGTSGNLVQGNYIGLDASGSVALGNGFADAAGGNYYPGVSLSGATTDNTIGGTTVAARNIIAGNCAQGISISGAGTSNNLVAGNYIGLKADGTAALANGLGDPATGKLYSGVAIFSSASNNTVGGFGLGARNIISGNGAQGVVISSSGSNNAIVGNYIGTDPTGASAIGNGLGGSSFGFYYSGIQCFGAAANNLIQGNVISGSGAQGIALTQAGTNGNLVRANYIGVNAAGTAALPNRYAGVSIYSAASYNVIGGSDPGEGNVISGNSNQGVYLSDTGTTGNLVQGNYIGLNAAGTAALPNSFSGVTIANAATLNTIGGTFPGAGNVISGNLSQGVLLSGSGTNQNQIAGNVIGLDAAGITRMANGNSGVEIYNGPQSNTVGGADAGARNFIAGNTFNGVSIHESGSNNNLVQGNTIGLNTAGAAIGNGPTYPGINIYNSAQGNLIGGSAVGAANLISGNAADGVLVQSSAATNTISRNSITGNGGRGIGLSSGNNSQAAPTLISAVLGATGNLSGTNISGSYSSAVNSAYTLEFFANSAADNSGFGEGQHFLGSFGITTNNAGAASFSLSLPAAVPPGYTIAATATSSTGNTSGFSVARTVTASDIDADGVPDAYENFYGFNPNSAADAALDRDGDGQSNKAEYYAGTNPSIPGSTLRITGLSYAAGLMHLTFANINGKTYRLESKPALGPANAWKLSMDQIVGTGFPIDLTVPITPDAVPATFFRVVLAP